MQETYWNEYYSSNGEEKAPIVPSQFAAFIANEFSGQEFAIVDLGCGNGRDSNFFARYGHRVIGVDASIDAIKNCNQQIGHLDRITFVCERLGNPLLSKKIGEFSANDSLVLYARFLLHAITDEEEIHFFDLVKSISQNLAFVAVEFRTDKDATLTKITQCHSRRFIDPAKFIERAASHGLTPVYFTQGFGYAKFRDDDAHVGRIILKLMDIAIK